MRRARFTIKEILMAAGFLLCFTAGAETITFSADRMTGTAGDSSSRTVLSGSAAVNTESMSITADSIELYGEDFRYILAVGSVTGKNPESEMDFTCGRMTYDRETKIATLENGVNLIDIKNEVNASAELIEYNQETEIAVMQISVSLKQKDNTCTASYAIYRKEEQILDMRGNPQVVQGNDTFRAQEISLNLETQEITLDGRVRGSVTTTEKQSEDADEQQ